MQTSFPIPAFLRVLSVCVLAALFAPGLFGQSQTATTTMSREQLIAEGEKMADAQLAVQKPNIGWVAAVMWAGYADFSHVSPKSAYADTIAQLGESVHWTPLLRAKAPDHADDLCICQTFLDAYATQPNAARLGPTRSRFDTLCADLDKGGATGPPGPKGNLLPWWWCDALCMAPPAQARLSVITKNPKYLDAMNKEWWRTADLLYDKDEHLFFRDASFLGKKTKHGQKVFWSRGNGWVFAGLARTLPYIPNNYPDRARYVTMFKDMAERLASLQQADGTWRTSLLDRDQFPEPETSGTALDCFAYAWGINNGLLDRATYLPIVEKAWAALLAAKRPDGLLGYVQGVGKAPGPVKADGTQPYATGAFLMDVCELAKLAPITVPVSPPLVIPVTENAGAPSP